MLHVPCSLHTRALTPSFAPGASGRSIQGGTNPSITPLQRSQHTTTWHARADRQRTAASSSNAHGHANGLAPLWLRGVPAGYVARSRLVRARVPGLASTPPLARPPARPAQVLASEQALAAAD